MALLSVVKMTPEKREKRREFDEAAYHRVRALLADGMKRPDAITKAAKQMRVERRQVVAGYWQHVRRTGADA